MTIRQHMNRWRKLRNIWRLDEVNDYGDRIMDQLLREVTRG
jgi:hypothetical protein